MNDRLNVVPGGKSLTFTASPVVQLDVGRVQIHVPDADKFAFLREALKACVPGLAEVPDEMFEHLPIYDFCVDDPSALEMSNVLTVLDADKSKPYQALQIVAGGDMLVLYYFDDEEPETDVETNLTLYCGSADSLAHGYYGKPKGVADKLAMEGVHARYTEDCGNGDWMA